MRTDSKSLILAESSRLIGQIGNSIVLDLYARIREVEALVRTLGATVEHLPKVESMFMHLIPPLIDFQGDTNIAGGGVWPQPRQFDANRDRRSFFWGRNSANQLEYYDDYNQPGPGYHQEAWYVVGRYANRGQCVWSNSYMDPYSYQPMVTCTAPTFDAGTFAGVVTIDLKLEGLQEFIETWREKTGGYIFVLDRNNRFITFPDPALVRTVQPDSQGRLIQEFKLAVEFAEQHPLFLPIATAADGMNQAILNLARQQPNYASTIAASLSQESNQIPPNDADLVAAILANPLNGSPGMGMADTTTYLFQADEIEDDILLHEASTVFLFHVPQTYWKVIIVKPLSEAAIATYSIIQSEKMSSLGQLVAGVAHEVNNPINFIYGNLTYADNYTRDLIELVTHYQQHYPNPATEIQQKIDTCDFDFIVEDLPKILASMRVGADRIRQLVLSLRNFSRMDEAEIKRVNIHEGIDSTLLLLDSKFKPRPPHHPGIQIVTDYGALPLVECYPGSLNQVFMNILVNAIDALESLMPDRSGMADQDQFSPPGMVSPVLPAIRIRTEQISNASIRITIADNGPGIPDDLQKRLFDPFFTTKPVGKGTGLGLAICYQIITQKHGGQIRCVSSWGQGTEFQIEIPIRRS